MRSPNFSAQAFGTTIAIVLLHTCRLATGSASLAKELLDGQVAGVAHGSRNSRTETIAADFTAHGNFIVSDHHQAKRRKTRPGPEHMRREEVLTPAAALELSDLEAGMNALAARAVPVGAAVAAQPIAVPAAPPPVLEDKVLAMAPAVGPAAAMAMGAATPAAAPAQATAGKAAGAATQGSAPQALPSAPSPPPPAAATPLASTPAKAAPINPSAAKPNAVTEAAAPAKVPSPTTATDNKNSSTSKDAKAASGNNSDVRKTLLKNITGSSSKNKERETVQTTPLLIVLLFCLSVTCGVAASGAFLCAVNSRQEAGKYPLWTGAGQRQEAISAVPRRSSAGEFKGSSAGPSSSGGKAKPPRGGYTSPDESSFDHSTSPETLRRHAAVDGHRLPVRG